MIFSIFSKKNGGRKSSSAHKTSAKDDPVAAPGLTANTSVDFANSILAQRHIARATERKIDAIEYEMSRDILTRKFDPLPGSVTPASQRNAELDLFDLTIKSAPVQFKNPDNFEPTLALRSSNTEFLINPDAVGHVADTAIENIPALEEAAILFASEQFGATELILQGLIANESYSAMNASAWLMLFDLYQISNDRSKFEQLSLDYVSKLEISAPIWRETGHQTTPPREQKSFAPGISFSGKLNEQISKQADRLPALIKQHDRLRIEFVRITELSVAGCEILLQSFRLLKKSKHELSVVGAHHLIQFCRALIAVGRRDDSDAPWLLLLELLQLTNDQAGFEEASIDYCITYEVSPPSFEAPHNKTIAASVGISVEFVEADRFSLPRIIEGSTTELIENIRKFSLDHHSVQLDCTQLDRIDFSSCGQLLSGLIPLSKELNISIEFHDVNHLVNALLNAMGFKNIAVIFPRKG